MFGDLGVGAALGDKGDQFPFPGLRFPGLAGVYFWGGSGVVSIRAYSTAVARLIAAPRSSAVRVRSVPSAWRAARRGCPAAQTSSAAAMSSAMISASVNA